jgi:hypothetical protein
VVAEGRLAQSAGGAFMKELDKRMKQGKVEVKLNIPVPDGRGGVLFPGFTGTILAEYDDSVVIEHQAVPGQPLVVEQVSKSAIFSLRKVSSVLT